MTYCARDTLGTGAPDTWQLHRCVGCHSIFLDPRPDPDSIGRAYEAYYTHAPADRFGYARGVPRLLLAWMHDYLNARYDWTAEPRSDAGRWLCAAYPPLAWKLDYLARHLEPGSASTPRRVLDVGCGNGEFLALAASAGWEVHGIEPDPAARRACAERGIHSVHASMDALPDALRGGFGAVTSSNSIEHLPEPREFLATVGDFMAADARIWIATPNPGGLGLRLFGASWRGLEPSRHLCVPSQQALRQMLSAAGFSHATLLPRGSHGKTIARESAEVAGRSASSRPGRWVARMMGVALRGWCATVGAILPRAGEETVIVARWRATANKEGEPT